MNKQKFDRDWRINATIKRLISNLPEACVELRKQGLTSLPFQIERDLENLISFQGAGDFIIEEKTAQ